MAKTILSGLNSLLRGAFLLLFLLTFSYSVYALWDNQQIYAQQDRAADALQQLRPQQEEGEACSGEDFSSLQAINPDVCAWLTLEGTGVDYPVVQTQDNLTYLNRDVYGEFSLSGSIFLDARCARDFSSSYSLLYGHHLEGGRMFGDLTRYEAEEFFQAHTGGTLMLPSGRYALQIFACLVVPASEPAIFQPLSAAQDTAALLDFVQAQALQLRPEVLSRLRAAPTPQILCLSTCSTAYTDARTVVLAAMQRTASQFGKEEAP